MCWTAFSASAPAISISPMWLTSNSPARVRTAMCSSTMPGVFDRHVPAAELDHAGAERPVPRVERRLLQGARNSLSHQDLFVTLPVALRQRDQNTKRYYAARPLVKERRPANKAMRRQPRAQGRVAAHGSITPVRGSRFTDRRPPDRSGAGGPGDQRSVRKNVVTASNEMVRTP